MPTGKYIFTHHFLLSNGIDHVDVVAVVVVILSAMESTNAVIEEFKPILVWQEMIEISITLYATDSTVYYYYWSSPVPCTPMYFARLNDVHAIASVYLVSVANRL